MSCELQVDGCKLLAASFGLRTAYGLTVTWEKILFEPQSSQSAALVPQQAGKERKEEASIIPSVAGQRLSVIVYLYFPNPNTIFTPMNFDNHRMITILASVLLVIAFFMPWISVGGLFSVSAWDLLTGRFEATLPWGAYVLFLVPIAAALLLFQKLLSRSTWRLLYFIPLLAIVGLFTYAYIEYERSRSTSEDGIDIDLSLNRDFTSALLDVVGLGFWLTIALSIFLFILGCVRVRRVNRLETTGERTLFSDEGQPGGDNR